MKDEDLFKVGLYKVIYRIVVSEGCLGGSEG